GGARLGIGGWSGGFVLGWGLLVSGMMRPEKVLGFLDIFGAWDASLLVLMATALVVSGIGFDVVKERPPLFAPKCLWPDKTAIDAPLVTGAGLVGIGWGRWGLRGRGAGPGVENVGTVSPGLIVFVAAMALGMTAHDLWQRRRSAARLRQDQALMAGSDGWKKPLRSPGSGDPGGKRPTPRHCAGAPPRRGRTGVNDAA